MWITGESKVQSWRLYGENNMILSIKFKPVAAITSSNHDVQPSLSSGQYYRSKPPSTVARDRKKAAILVDF